ncbi:MAG TPA: MMPL family transporter [Solirubrobacteraceae bacterium]|jgi:RND superfamily putative drug exporter|nr:MMPL family transporter [Solirubrobacteraceae bacterium]
MTRITRWVLAHKRIVVGFWVVVTVIGMASAGPASEALKQKFSVPGREGWEANQQIQREFHGTGGAGAPLLAVVTLPGSASIDSPTVLSELRAVEARLQRTLPGVRMAGYAGTHSATFLSRDRHTTFVVAYPRPEAKETFEANPEAAKHASAAIDTMTVAGAPVRVTGYDALAAQSGGGKGPGVLLEAMLGGLGALLVLAFVFGSFLALVPLMMAIAAIMTTFLVVYGLTAVTEVSPIVQYLIALIGLGVSIDYSLLVVVRWREELARGAAHEQAIERAMATAGRAVVFSGTTVAIGLLALIALPLPFLRSVGYGGMLIPLVSVAVALTLLPVVLAKLGPRLDWPHVRNDEHASRSWTGWANLIVRGRWVAALGATLVLAALVLAATNLQLGSSNVNTIAKEGVAKQGLLALERSGIGSGALVPAEVLVNGSTSPARVAQRLNAVAGVHGAVAPESPEWRHAGVAVLDEYPTPDASTAAGRDTLERVQSAAHAFGPEVKVGGIGAQNQDFIEAVYGNFPLMIALIALITFVLLARAFRSLLLPLKAVILNVISVAAAWGVLELVWQQGHGSQQIWGISATGSITAWIPLMVFAFLFGLSMDYEVFILSRMREEYDATGSTNTAVVRGIGRTGRLVTSAALILFLAFTSLASGPETEVKVLATGLAAGILLDATVIRALFVPAIVSLLGRWNWWLPPLPARWLRVEPSLPPRAATARE